MPFLDSPSADDPPEARTHGATERRRRGRRPARHARGLFAAAALGVILVAGVGCSRSAGEAGDGGLPDIFLLTVDTLRADHLGAYGHEPARTPTIDALAARGTLFERAYTPLPRTTPGLASLLTGLLPVRHGSREVGDPIDDVPLLSELLSARGYATLGVSGNGAAGGRQNLGRGFDQLLAGRRELPGTEAGPLTTKALELVDGATLNAETPLFLWVHYVDPHFPYRPPKPWREGAGGEECLELIDGRWKESHIDVFDDVDGVSSRALESCRRLYDAEIAYVDAELRRLLDGLAERGRPADDALVVFTADHGENLGERRLFYEHGPHVHDASLRVPLIVAGPGVATRRDSDTARLEDLMPTILSLLGVPDTDRPASDGVDLGPRLRPPPFGLELARRTDEPPPVLAESGSVLHLRSVRSLVSGRADARSCTHGPRFSLCGRDGEAMLLFDRDADPGLTVDVASEHPEAIEALLEQRQRWPAESARELAVLDGRFKLVATPERGGGWKRALYDLEADPGERRDVAGRHPEVVEQLGVRLDALAAEIGAVAPAEARDDEALATLRALGYVE
ncbi:MAG: sulfatase [Acidobacteriota bacterium]